MSDAGALSCKAKVLDGGHGRSILEITVSGVHNYEAGLQLGCGRDRRG